MSNLDLPQSAKTLASVTLGYATEVIYLDVPVLDLDKERDAVLAALPALLEATHTIRNENWSHEEAVKHLFGKEL